MPAGRLPAIYTPIDIAYNPCSWQSAGQAGNRQPETPQGTLRFRRAAGGWVAVTLSPACFVALQDSLFYPFIHIFFFFFPLKGGEEKKLM